MLLHVFFTCFYMLLQLVSWCYLLIHVVTWYLLWGVMFNLISIHHIPHWILFKRIIFLYLNSITLMTLELNQFTFLSSQRRNPLNDATIRLIKNNFIFFQQNNFLFFSLYFSVNAIISVFTTNFANFKNDNFVRQAVRKIAILKGQKQCPYKLWLISKGFIHEKWSLNYLDIKNRLNSQFASKISLGLKLERKYSMSY